MAKPGGFTLASHTLGGRPLVNHVLRRLRFEEFLVRHLPPPDPQAELAPAAALGVLTRNLLLARVPLYGPGEWARGWAPTLRGLRAEQVALLNEDCVGRALDRLFDADPAALVTTVVVHMVKEFAVSLEQLHNDSTTLTLHGEYADATGRLRGVWLSSWTLRCADSHAKRAEDEFDGWPPTITERQSAQLHDVLAVSSFQREPQRSRRISKRLLQVASTLPLPSGSPRRRARA
jgi:hypothetical protein